MNKKYFSIPVVACLIVGIIGCSNNNQGADQSVNNRNAQPMGYFSNENHGNGYGDNDGPLVEMMDHTFGTENNDNRTRQILQNRDEDGNPGNPTKPLAKYDKNWFQRDNRFSRSDVNYHGHLESRNQTYKTLTGNHTADEKQSAKKIRTAAAKVENVEDVRSVAYGRDVIISVDLRDQNRASETRKNIMRAVKPYLNGRTCTVRTDEGTIGRPRNTDHRVREDEANEQIDANS